MNGKNDAPFADQFYLVGRFRGVLYGKGEADFGDHLCAADHGRLKGFLELVIP